MGVDNQLKSMKMNPNAKDPDSSAINQSIMKKQGTISHTQAGHHIQMGRHHTVVQAMSASQRSPKNIIIVYML